MNNFTNSGKNNLVIHNFLKDCLKIYAPIAGVGIPQRTHTYINGSSKQN